MKAFFIFFISLFCSNAFSWGERGHNSVGYNAVVLFNDNLSANERELTGDSFRVRVFQMGHLANIPDFSWKDPRKKFNKELNSTTHRFNPEKILGNLPLTTLAKKIRALDTDLKKIKETYKTYAKEYERERPLNLEMDIGTAPWRVQEIYNKIVEAFKCAKNKTPLKGQLQNFEDPFKDIYKCTDKTTWNEDVYAAFVYAGLLGHFIGDLSQPFHNTSNYDGWFEGQGGIHNYHETQLVENYDQKFSLDILEKSRSKSFQNSVWSKLKVDFSKPQSQTLLAFNMVADGIVLYPKILELDRKYAIIKKGDQVPHTKDRGTVYATRKPPSDPTVLKQNRSLIIERLATSTFLLSKLWYQAWSDAGKPNISNFGYLAAPYPQEIPFLKAEYLE